MYTEIRIIGKCADGKYIWEIRQNGKLAQDNEDFIDYGNFEFGIWQDVSGGEVEEIEGFIRAIEVVTD